MMIIGTEQEDKDKKIGTQETQATPPQQGEEYVPTPYEVFDQEKAYQNAIEKSKPYIAYLRSKYTKPEPKLTEEQQRKARVGASITDGLSAVAKMFAHGQGAYIQKDNQPSNTKTTGDRLKEIQEKYERDALRYNQLIAGIEAQTLAEYVRGERQNHQLRNKQIAEDNQRIWSKRQQDERYKKEMDLWKEKSESRIKEIQEMAKRDAKKLANPNKQTKGSGKTTTVVIPATEGQKGATKNTYTGKYERVLQMTEAEIQGIWNSVGGLEKYIKDNHLYHADGTPYSELKALQHIMQNRYKLPDNDTPQSKGNATTGGNWIAPMFFPQDSNGQQGWGSKYGGLKENKTTGK